MENLTRKEPRIKNPEGAVTKEALELRLKELEAESQEGQTLLQSHQSQAQSLQAQLLQLQGATALARELIEKSNSSN